MASVSSLDQDMRNLRMSRYTPQAAKAVRSWIEESLNEHLPPGDLLEVLKDGVALCKLANLVLPAPGIKFKNSSMPFMQMENISHFLKACEVPPLSMPAHDRFLTVDLYESKDPAQVLQCLAAFSRHAHTLKPNSFRTTIGSRKSGGTMSPTSTGAASTNGSASWKQPSFARSPSPTKTSSAMSSSTRPLTPSLTGGSTGSQKSAGGTTAKSAGPVSSWSSRTDEGVTSPAWNIHQYGYMGGATQGNQGISFGARRQITSQAPSVPGLAEKERARKEKVAEEERSRQQAEEVEQQRRVEQEVEDERERVEEEQRWEDETRRLRDEERSKMEEQKRQWAEQERRWKVEEEARRKEDAEMAALVKKPPPEKPRVPSSGILRGQTLSQYQREQGSQSKDADKSAVSEETPEQKRVRELEKQLEEARERERQYQAEREERLRRGKDSTSRPSTARTETPEPQRPPSQPSEASWTGDEREFLRQQWQQTQDTASSRGSTATQAGAQQQQDQQQRPLPTQPPKLPTRSVPQVEIEDEAPPTLPQRAQPSTSTSSLSSDAKIDSSPLGSANRPPPTPDKEFEPYTPIPATQNRSERFLSTTTTAPTPRVSNSRETNSTTLSQSSRSASQTTTKATASKSLLEREMERERERQREWEVGQQELKDQPRDASQGTGEGKSWDVNQYGFVGGDGMNKGSSAGSGIDFGVRRQILGPREMKR